MMSETRVVPYGKCLPKARTARTSIIIASQFIASQSIFPFTFRKNTTHPYYKFERVDRLRWKIASLKTSKYPNAGLELLQGREQALPVTMGKDILNSSQWGSELISCLQDSICPICYSISERLGEAVMVSLRWPVSLLFWSWVTYQADRRA